MSTRKATTELEVKGGDQAARELGKVDQASNKVTKQTADSTKHTKDATDAQQKLNASESDYTELLGRVHPALGALAAATVKAGRVAGDLATKKIELGKALKAVTSGARNAAKSLLLIGAGGAVVAAIAAIVAVVRTMEAAYKAATEAIRADADALDEATKKIKEQEAAIRDLANARERMAKIGLRESQQVRQAAQRDVERFGGAVGFDTAAKVRAEFHGAGLTEEQIQQLVLAAAGGAEVTPKPGMEAPDRAGWAQYQLGLPGTQQAISASRKSAADLRRQLAQDAYRELQTSGGGVANLAEFLTPYLRPGQDATEVARRMQDIGPDIEGAARRGPDAAVRPLFAPFDIGRLALEAAGGNIPVESAEPQGGWMSGWGKDYVSVPRDELNQMTIAMRELTRELQQGHFAPAPSYGYAVFNGADAAAFEKRVTNGANHRRNIE